MTRAALALATTLAAAAWLLPEVALACPVCFDANDANREAFFVSTIFMSLFPLALIGGLIGFLVLRARAAEAAENRGAPVAAAPEAPRADGGEPMITATRSAEGGLASARTDGGAP